MNLFEPVFWTLASWVVSIVATLAILGIAIVRMIFREGWQRWAGAGVLLGYLVVFGVHIADRMAFKAWQEADLRQSDLTGSPAALWIHAEPRKDKAESRLRQPELTYLLTGKVDFIERGSESVVRWRLAVHDPRCLSGGPFVLNLLGGSIGNFTTSNGICAIGEKVTEPEAPIILRETAFEVPGTAGETITRITLEETTSGTVLDEAFEGSVRLRRIPPRPEILRFSKIRKTGIWQRHVGFERIRRIPAAPSMLEEVYQFSGGYRGLGVKEAVERFGINEQLMLDALSSDRQDIVVRSINFGCWLHKDLPDAVLSRMEEIWSAPEGQAQEWLLKRSKLCWWPSEG